MTKPQKSNKEGKKKAQLTLLEKRAAKRGKVSGKLFPADVRTPKNSGAAARSKPD